MSGLMRGTGRVKGGVLLFALLTLIGGSREAVAQGMEPSTSPLPGTCASCHDSDAVLRASVLPHASSVTCLDCHHIGMEADSATLVRRRLAACSSCHEDKAVPEGHAEGAATCVQCHAVHGEPRIDRAGPMISARCQSCHGTPHELHGAVTADAPQCTDCHGIHEMKAPAAPEAPSAAPSDAAAPEGTRFGAPGTAAGSHAFGAASSCVSCHEGVHPSHPTSGAGAIGCTGCHQLSEPVSAVYADGRLAQECVSCHETSHTTHVGVGAGSPVCTDCHSFTEDPPIAQVSKTTMGERCGACHEGPYKAYLSGGHAEGLLDPETHASMPTCLTCHEGIIEDKASSAPGRLAATERCMDCHGSDTLTTTYGLSKTVVKSYTDDYHGATIDFLKGGPNTGAPDVLTCEDCHGAHAVGWSKEAVVAEVCQRCHEDADPKLAGAWLGHNPPGPRNQPMVWLAKIGYYGLIPFMLLGLSLTIIYELLYERRHGARMHKAEGVRRLWARLTRRQTERPRLVTRFSVWERVEHMIAGVGFVTLVVTGLPQLWPEVPFTQHVIAFYGGIHTTRLIHRAAGFTFAGLLIVHVLLAVFNAFRKRRMPIMLPTLEDFDALPAIIRHFLGGGPKPKVGKFDFAQKFEYGGMLMGGLVMTVSGLTLVYPEVVTRLLPGQVVAMLRTIHGLEATFATLVVLLWHSWGVILRPAIFPLDTSIFTGKVTVERLKEEHPLEYERLFPAEAARDAEQEREHELNPATAGPAQAVGV